MFRGDRSLALFLTTIPSEVGLVVPVVSRGADDIVGLIGDSKVSSEEYVVGSGGLFVCTRFRGGLVLSVDFTRDEEDDDRVYGYLEMRGEGEWGWNIEIWIWCDSHQAHKMQDRPNQVVSHAVW